MTATRCEVVIAVQDGQTRRIEEPARAQRVQCAVQKPLVPPVEQITGDREMVRRLRDDVIELPPESVEVAGISEVEVG